MNKPFSIAELSDLYPDVTPPELDEMPGDHEHRLYLKRATVVEYPKPGTVRITTYSVNGLGLTPSERKALELEPT